MELQNPSHHPHDGLAGEPLSPAGLPSGLDPAASSRPLEIMEEGGGGEKVYVAVGKSVEKGVSLLHWSFGRFKGGEICILHVHQPSPVISTLLGKLPASQANPEVVSAFRREEREQTKKLLFKYSSFCSEYKVKAIIIMNEADKVQKGIVDMVKTHGIRKLVMGAIPENCMKVKISSSKANYASKHAPSFCEIWFINKGKHLWTREAVEGPSSLPFYCQAEITTAEILRSRSLQYATSVPSGLSNCVLGESVPMEVDFLRSLSNSSSKFCPPYPPSSSSPTSTSSNSGYTSAVRSVSSDSEANIEEESLHIQLTDAGIVAEASRNEGFLELLKAKMELEAMEAISKVSVFESAHAHELKLRKEAEDALITVIHDQEKVLEEREKVTRELQRTMRHVALLENRAKEANCRCDEAAEELKFIQTSIATLRQEKQRIRHQKMEAGRWLERWRSHGQAGAANCNGYIGFVEDLPKLAEFSLLDLQTATCNFSESFKVGQGGFGCVYKGEMLGRTVAIKKLYSHNSQGQSEFQQEVQVLGKLQHPHLVTLLGACPEAWSLVYEYLPNGSLQHRLFKKSNISPLTWKIRARIIAQIASALCFLHSSKPEKIIHGDLKPENILLDSELSCKICDFGISRLVPEEIFYCPSFQRNTEPTSAFPYTDPEFHRIGFLMPKSDIYSFGLIILQLLSGRPPVGLACEIRKAVSCRKLELILDLSAGEWPMFVARRLVDLGLQCCELNSRDRPELNPTLVRELEQLHVSEERPVPSFFLCPILQEIMHDPQVAADGFTYEGEALRGWLENGRETSPMTNLKLNHLQLTPNHAIRLAIQDWLCKS